PRGRRARPRAGARGLHPRPLDRGAGCGRRRPRRDRRPPGGRTRGPGGPRLVPSRARRRSAPARAADGAGGAPARALSREPQVRDPRVANLARILVGYSLEVADGETCLIEGSAAGEPMIAAVYEEVLRAG